MKKDKERQEGASRIEDQAGMDDHLGHEEEHMAHQHHGNFKEIFLKSLPLGLLIMILSPMMGIRLPFQFTFKYSDLIASLASTILIIYGGRPFYLGAINEFKEKSPGMMALVAMGIGVSYSYSLVAVFSRYVWNLPVMDFFFEFASLILIMLLGHWIEMKALGDAGDAQKELAELMPKQADTLLEDGSILSKAIADLKIGDLVRVQAGENIPADGIVTKGSSRVNEALLTGESKPIEKSVGDQVIGGSTNKEGVLFIEVRELGEKSFLSQVQELIRDAQNQPSRAENLANKVASALFYIAISVSLVSFLAWLILADLATAVRFAVTTLVIACPHALGLAIPLVVARSTSLGASRGLLVKDREALELTTKADVMILDKTGTLTTGEFKVLDISSLNSKYEKKDILSLMAGLEGGSSHPIAQSIVDYAKQKEVAVKPFESTEILSGLGITGKIQGTVYKLISPKGLDQKVDYRPPKQASISFLLENNEVIGAVALGDELKESSPGLIKSLKSNGIEPIMATGDNEESAKAIALELGINYQANLSPRDKHDLVEKLKNQGKTVIMVGDGVNDAPSLALADVGIAIGAGTQVAIDSADLILTKSDPGDIATFLELARKTNRKMKENLLWGAGYNFIAIPLAAGVLAPLGLTLSPALGAVLMSVSTVLVAINAMLLKLKDR